MTVNRSGQALDCGLLVFEASRNTVPGALCAATRVQTQKQDRHDRAVMSTLELCISYEHPHGLS